jgi:uncharacterized protein YndB with AHSA1/START domain
MTEKILPIARACMLIRKPVAEVFNAFVDPAVTTQFWFSRSTGKLTEGSTVSWYWDFYGVSGDVFVKTVEKNKYLRLEWPTPVEISFTEKAEGETFVSVTATGFTGTLEEKIAQALDSTEGFNLVLSACKVFLEYGIDAGLIKDKNPDAWVR